MSDRPDRLVPGAARASGESLRNLLMADGRPPPDVLLTESYEFLGDADIAFERYTSPEFAAAEAEHLWPRVWQWACRAEHIPEPGDYYVHDVGDLSALIVRTAPGEIKAYANACMHRGTQLKPPGSCGWSRQLKCPFHGWTWSLDGRLVHLPDAWDFPHASVIHTIATRNPAVQPPLSEQEHLAQIMGSKLDGAPVPELPPGTLARDFYAAWHRDQLSARYGRDLSHQVESLGNLGRVFDEDAVNMGAQTRGFKASRKRGQTLGNYQEVRVRHLHLRVDDYLDRDSTNNPNPVED